LAGCANKDNILPTPDQDMEAVYRDHMQGIGDGKIMDTRSLLRRPMEESDVQLSEYVRTEKNQLQARFKRIPNPTLYMFVAPHLAAQSEVPIPGYVTEFRMWTRDHYAMPGEVSDMTSQFQGDMR
tara:strand:+ start:15498 stop:15872 length:375 start_codon:yes stop_codon:yes gene_type:complete